MKLATYLAHLQKLLKEHPEAKFLDVIYSCDDEGNFYDYVNFGAGLMHFDQDENEAQNPTAEKPANCICLN